MREYLQHTVDVLAREMARHIVRVISSRMQIPAAPRKAELSRHTPHQGRRETDRRKRQSDAQHRAAITENLI